MTAYFDPFTVESIVLGYHMPAATSADKAAAARELARLGLSRPAIAARLDMTERSVERLKKADIEPLPPLPDWAQDYEREWPKCSAGHELTPDNYRERWDGRVLRRQCIICCREYGRRNAWKYDGRYREAKKAWIRKRRQQQKESA